MTDMTPRERLIAQWRERARRWLTGDIGPGWNGELPRGPKELIDCADELAALPEPQDRTAEMVSHLDAVRWTENSTVLYDIIRAIADQYRQPTEEQA